MSVKVQMNSRVSPETVELRNQLVEHFNASTPLGKVSEGDVIELAIKELYEKYIGDLPAFKGGDNHE